MPSAFFWVTIDGILTWRFGDLHTSQRACDPCLDVLIIIWLGPVGFERGSVAASVFLLEFVWVDRLVSGSHSLTLMELVRQSLGGVHNTMVQRASSRKC